MDEIVNDFLIESGENLDRLDQELVKLESDPQAADLLASIFRTIHTIKGSCGFLGFGRLEKVAHAGESLLSKLRDGELSLDGEITSGLLTMVDAVRHMLSEIQGTEHDGENDYAELREELKRLQSAGSAAAATPEAGPPQEADQSIPIRITEAPRILEVEGESAEAKEDPAMAGGLPETAKATESVNAEPASPAEQEKPRAEVPESNQSEPHPSKRSSGETKSVTGAEKEEGAAAQHPPDARRETSIETVRVGINLLDKLMNLVGELVLAPNQLLQFSNSTQDAGFHAVSQRMNLIATELQEDVMKTRMQPIGNIWNKFPRTVRDLAHSCGKEVRLEMEGQDTELDRTIIEAIKDPLTHLLRNSMDHGIEAPEVRKKAGKDSTGLLRLRAFHEGGQVNIEISDDGGGLNLDRIRQKAMERGLITDQQAARLPDRDVFNLIFLPGFSTAEKVTNVSGRGVGMDVVKTNVEKIGGTVDIQSSLGKGTTVRVKIPLTLAIIPALIANCGGERFAIPQVSLTELVRLEGEKGIETVHGAPVYRLRGRLLPLVYLRETLNGSSDAEAEHHAMARRPETLDFSAARDQHRQWMSRLHSVLSGELVMTAEEAGSAKECALGKWLYGPGLKQHSTVAAIQTLERTHVQFHDKVKAVLAAKSGKDAVRANAGLGEVSSLSTAIVELLGAVEGKVSDNQNVNIVVLQAEGRQFGLVVDEILDTQEIVVKPLGKQLKGINVYSGATIMGDGRVALILDVTGLAQRTKVIAEAHEQAHKEGHSEAGAEATRDEHSLLLAENGMEGRVAIPLSMVARLEEFPRTVVERAGNQEVMQYRGQIIPLVRLSQIIPAASDAELLASAASIQVVVYSEGKCTVGLIVDRIVDIVEERAAVESLAPRAGVVGSFVTQKHVTDLLDLPAIVRAAVPGLLEAVEN